MFDVFYLNKKPNRFPHEQLAHSLEHAGSLSRTRYFWVINYLADYEGFDFHWEPPPWQAHQRHAWSSQHQTDARTYLIPQQGFEDTNYHSDKIFVRNDAPLVLIDHGNSTDKIPRAPDRTTRFVGSYLETLRRVVARADSEWIWVASSVCDYTHFDWHWHPSIWQEHMIHVFASDEQRFGDTFYLHVPTARQTLAQAELLDWTNLNFVPDIAVPRWPMPVNRHTEVTQVAAVKSHNFTAPLEIFTMTESPPSPPTVSLWRRHSRAVTPLTPGATTVIVPRDVCGVIKDQLYDYDYVNSEHVRGADPTLDVVYCSNGESCEEYNYRLLCQAVPRDMRVHWVRGVQGRVASQHAAARLSTTEFYFFVPAKLSVHRDFNWRWHPDMMQSPKHWIFYAHNPITGLTYGHGAIVCNSRRLALETSGTGLDFTLEKSHQVVPIICGTVSMGGDPRTIWRTAYREVVKLAFSNHQRADVDTEYRISQWLTMGNGDMGIWSQRGAEAGWQFVQHHRDDMEMLRTTYEWQHLNEIFDSTYPSVAGIL